MRALLIILVAFLGISAALAQGWPTLPAKGFISGRAATDQDVADGNAIFVLKVYGTPVGKPLEIVIPQYAYLTKGGGKPARVVVIQAEAMRGIKLFGIRDMDGKESVVK